MKKNDAFALCAKTTTDKVGTTLVPGTYDIEALEVKAAVAAVAGKRGMPKYPFLKCSSDMNIAVSRLFRPIFGLDNKAIVPIITGLGDNNSAGAKIDALVTAATPESKVNVTVTTSATPGFTTIFSADGKQLVADQEWKDASHPILTFKGVEYKAAEAKGFDFAFDLAVA